jgi:hypothetical protein
VKDVPAAAVAIAIRIAGGVDGDAVRAAVLEEVTVVATPGAVAADAEDGKIKAVDSKHEGPQRCGPFSLRLASLPRAEIPVWRGHSVRVPYLEG